MKIAVRIERLGGWARDGVPLEICGGADKERWERESALVLSAMIDREELQRARRRKKKTLGAVWFSLIEGKSGKKRVKIYRSGYGLGKGLHRISEWGYRGSTSPTGSR